MFNDFKREYKKVMKTKKTRKKKMIQALILVASVISFVLSILSIFDGEQSKSKTLTLLAIFGALQILHNVLEGYVWDSQKSIAEKREDHLKKTWAALCICNLKSEEAMTWIEEKCNEEIAKLNSMSTLLAILGIYISLIVACIEGLDIYIRIAIIVTLGAIIITMIVLKGMISSFFTNELLAMRDDVRLTKIDRSLDTPHQ